MKKQIKSLLCGLCAAALALGCAGCGGSAGPEVPAKVTDIMVWTYYNGDQLESFTSLVEQFNETVGAQKGIKVSTESQGSINDLETSVLDSAEGKVGAAAMPNIFSAYADTAYALDQMGMVVDLAPYLTEEEKRALCSIAREVRPDFIKTSTGFGSSGATFEDVVLMKKCVGDEVKIKAAGGIRTLDTALRMIELGVSRIGSTASVSIVEELKHRL